VAAADLLGLGPALSLPLGGLELTEEDSGDLVQVLFSPCARLHAPVLESGAGDRGVGAGEEGAVYQRRNGGMARPAQLFVQFEDVGWLAWAPALHRALTLFNSK